MVRVVVLKKNLSVEDGKKALFDAPGKLLFFTQMEYFSIQEIKKHVLIRKNTSIYC